MEAIGVFILYGRKISASLIEEFLTVNLREYKAFSSGEIVAFYTESMDFITGFDISFVPTHDIKNTKQFIAESVAEFYNSGCKINSIFPVMEKTVEFVRTPKDRFVHSFLKEEKERHINSDIGYFQIIIKD